MARFVPQRQKKKIVDAFHLVLFRFYPIYGSSMLLLSVYSRLPDQTVSQDNLGGHKLIIAFLKTPNFRAH